MRIVVLTGMSGSGKTNASRALEDIGFYAIDNLPVPLIDKLVDLFSTGESPIERMVLVVDARTSFGEGGLAHQHEDLRTVADALEKTRQAGHTVDLVFLDSDDDILVRRFSETRRRHPLSPSEDLKPSQPATPPSGKEGLVRSGIEAERRLLSPLREAANTILNTSEMSVHDLRRTIKHTFAPDNGFDGSLLSVTAMSFGFKHGVPTEADLVIDVRFLPNPHFVESLKPKTGEDTEVAKYVLEREETKEFLQRFLGLIEYLLPQYEREGKSYLTIAFGCTGGRHRSVALAIELSQWLEGRGFRGRVVHRDVGR